MNTYYALIVPIILTALLSGCGGNSKPQSAGTVVPPAASSSQIPAEKEASLTYYLPTEDGLHILPATVKVKAADRTFTLGGIRLRIVPSVARISAPLPGV